ncbi:hypothetical protein TSUD_308310 [Trifolium subterraneum]|nr:hypothetical protein TSUD_308310 [Trifolium subterraneum]
MRIPSEIRNMWVANKNTSLMIASPAEEQKILRSNQCTAVRMIPWAKANLNYTAQALIISSVSVASFFIVAEKTIMACARKHSLLLEESLKQEK